MALRTFLLLYVAALGLIVGSYLNVVIHRLPRRVSTVRPRSRCPACGSQIRVWQNLPVLSFLLLGGRCRECHSRISWRYPFVEALTAALFVLAAVRFGFSPTAALAAAFSALMIALAGIDLDHLILPDRLTLSAGVLALVLHAVRPRWLPWCDLGEALIGALVGGGVLLALSTAWYLLRRIEGMGLGDVKMLAMVGAFLGWKGVLVALLVAALCAALVGLPWAAVRGLGLKHKLPFGPFLSFGAVVALFAAAELIGWYFGAWYFGGWYLGGWYLGGWHLGWLPAAGTP